MAGRAGARLPRGFATPMRAKYRHGRHVFPSRMARLTAPSLAQKFIDSDERSPILRLAGAFANAFWVPPATVNSSILMSRRLQLDQQALVLVGDVLRGVLQLGLQRGRLPFAIERCLLVEVQARLQIGGTADHPLQRLPEAILGHLGEPEQAPRLRPARGSPLWEMQDRGLDAINPQAQPMPDYEFGKRVAW